MAAAFAVAAVGQLLRAGAALREPPGSSLAFPNVGDVVALVVPVLAIAGLLSFARAVPGLTGVGLPAARILLDAVLLACSLALVVWRFGFQERATHGTGATVLAVVAVLADLVVGCMAGLLALRRPVPHLLVAALGVGAVVIGHIVMVQQALDGGWSWPGRALMCIGWPLMAGGLLSYRPSSGRLPRDPPVDYDSRLSAVTATGTAVVLGVGVLTILLWPPVDRVSLWLVLALIVTVWIREMLTTAQRTGLVRRLQAEATLDPLSGLANRRNLTRRLRQVSGSQPCAG